MKLLIITVACLISIPGVWLPECESAALPLPQKIISGSQLQRDDCVVLPNIDDDDFGPYIEEFLFTDDRAGISLYSCINWTEGFLKSEGTGKKGSRRAAELVARNNALKTLLVVNLHSSGTFQDYFTRQANVKLNIQNVLIKNAEIQELPADPDTPDLVKVVIRIPFYGISGLTSFLINDQELFYSPPTRSEKDTPPVSETKVEPENFTGVIIDARHLSSLQPALLPQIISEDGEVVYEASQVDKEILQNHGMIEYVSGGNLPKTSWRSGSNPLLIQPLLLASAGEPPSSYLLLAQEKARKRRTKGNNLVVEGSDSEGQIPVNVVISVEDAKKLKQLNEQQQLDTQGKYTILIGGEIGGVRGQYLDGIYTASTRFL